MWERDVVESFIETLLWHSPTPERLALGKAEGLLTALGKMSHKAKFYKANRIADNPTIRLANVRGGNVVHRANT